MEDHGLEPLLELGGSDLHKALGEQLLAEAMVHSRQIKQASEAEGANNTQNSYTP